MWETRVQDHPNWFNYDNNGVYGEFRISKYMCFLVGMPYDRRIPLHTIYYVKLPTFLAGRERRLLPRTQAAYSDCDRSDQWFPTITCRLQTRCLKLNRID